MTHQELWYKNERERTTWHKKKVRIIHSQVTKKKRKTSECVFHSVSVRNQYRVLISDFFSKYGDPQKTRKKRLVMGDGWYCRRIACLGKLESDGVERRYVF